MKDLMGLMGRAREMQAKMETLQAEIAALHVEGRSGGGAVTVRMDGKMGLIGLSIDPALLKPEDAGILEDLLMAAHADARGKLDAAMQAKTAELTAGLPIPPGFKLPF